MSIATDQKVHQLEQALIELEVRLMRLETKIAAVLDTAASRETLKLKRG